MTLFNIDESQLDKGLIVYHEDHKGVEFEVLDWSGGLVLAAPIHKPEGNGLKKRGTARLFNLSEIMVKVKDRGLEIDDKELEGIFV